MPSHLYSNLQPSLSGVSKSEIWEEDKNRNLLDNFCIGEQILKKLFSYLRSKKKMKTFFLFVSLQLNFLGEIIFLFLNQNAFIS